MSPVDSAAAARRAAVPLATRDDLPAELRTPSWRPRASSSRAGSPSTRS